jgi:DNA ligase-1
MQDIITLNPLYKRDSKGKVRVWQIQVGSDNENIAGIRSTSGLVDGEKITSVWNMSVPKNIGRANATTAKTQAYFEAQAEWVKKNAKEYFADLADIDSYENFKPMLAHDFTKTPVTSGYTQPKLDGIRCVIDNRGMWTRAGKPIVSCPHIWESVKPIFNWAPNIVLDGELYNHELKADFQKITSLVRKSVNIGQDELLEASHLVEYHIYDMFDKDQPELTFTKRQTEIYNHIGELYTSNKLVIVKTAQADDTATIDRLYGEYTEAGYEGQMIRQDTAYECKRSKSLLERKEFTTDEFEVVEVVEGQGAWTGYAKRFILKLADGRTFGSGVRGTQAQLKALLESQEKTTWATCRYFELSNDGVPRFPVVIDYGTGKRND